MIPYERYLPRNHLNDLLGINVHGYSVCLAMQTMQIYAVGTEMVKSPQFKTTFHGFSKS